MLNKANRVAEAVMLHQKAHEAGMVAGNEHKPSTMVVQDAMTGETWEIKEGPCGFAWVHITGNTPANRAFIEGLLDAGLCTKDQHGVTPWYKSSVSVGYRMWVTHFNQSYERKRKYAEAYAKVLGEQGVTAYAMSRLD